MLPISKSVRRPVNLSLDSRLVEKVRAEQLNLSAIAEAAISHALAEVLQKRFHTEIAASVSEQAEYLAQYGSLAEAVRAMGADGGA